MKLYKLTNQDWTTRNGCKWGPMVSHPTSGEGNLCGPGWTHWYTHPLLAVFLNLIHANFPDPILWEGEGTVGETDHGLKVGCKDGMTVKIIPLPEVTTEQRIKFAILCAMEVYKEEKWTAWAKNWLSGKDRTKKSAHAAHAAHAAANAAHAAANAYAYAGYAAHAAAYAAHFAADAAAESTTTIDLIALAEKAIS